MGKTGSFRAAIFDFDGIIADSIPLHFESFRKLFGEEGVDFTFDDYQRWANGRPRDHVIRAILGDVEPGRLKELMARKERYILEILARKGLPPIPGSLELAKAFRGLGLRTAVASSSRTARRFLEALSPVDPALGPPPALFEVVLEGKDSRAPKPDPEIYLSTAKALGVPPPECIAIEDAANGVQAARAAGMLVVAVTTTESPEALKGAHAIFSSFAEIDPRALLDLQDHRGG
jgi:beta-phosphoglucomutase-like phosphatase (HAD superfamily)